MTRSRPSGPKFWNERFGGADGFFGLFLSESRRCDRSSKVSVEFGYCTDREIVARCVIVPEVPVTVMMYVPGVVPEFPPVPPPAAPPLPLPLQPNAPPTAQESSTSIARTLHHLRQRPGMPMSRMHARAVPPTEDRRNFPTRLRAEATVVAGMVFTVRVAV